MTVPASWMPAARPLTHERLRRLIDYDPDTGVFTWLTRDRSEFANDNVYGTWNTRYAGTTAGVLDRSVGYVKIAIDDRKHWGHRLAWFWMTGEWPTCEVDHRNGHRNDNRWANLRAADKAQQQANVGLRSDNQSGFKGVCRNHQNGKPWRATIRKDGRQRHLGFFDTAAEAGAAYARAAVEHFGEFARAS